MEFRQIVFHWIDRSCQPSIVGNKAISFVLLDLFQVMHLVRVKITDRPKHTYIHTYLHTYMHTYLHTYMHTYIINLHIYTYMHAYITCIDTYI